MKESEVTIETINIPITSDNFVREFRGWSMHNREPDRWTAGGCEFVINTFGGGKHLGRKVLRCLATS